jgi:hypothetical protein
MVVFTLMAHMQKSFCVSLSAAASAVQALFTCAEQDTTAMPSVDMEFHLKDNL